VSQVAALPAPPAQTPPPAAALTLSPPAAGYFERPLPAAVILGSFAAVTLPVGALVLLRPNSPLTWVYLWLFGMTHFVLTFTVYLTRDNLRYFASSRRNVAVFFAVPVAIFVLFDLLHTFRVGALFPVFALFFWGAIRLFDFAHLNRQTFGVLQLFKGRTGVKFPPTLRKLENSYLLAFVLVLMTTFLAGGVCPLLQPGGWLTVYPLAEATGARQLPLDALQAAWVGLAGVTAALFGLVLAGFRRVWKQSPGRGGFPAAVTYLLLQSIGAGMAALFLPLYLAALAIHYVEYHVLMVPRWAAVRLDPSSRLDRSFGWLRARPVAFYAVVVAVAAVVTAGSFAGMGMMGRTPEALSQPAGYLALIAIFDGIFVFHYFVEMFIWRFSDPHFRRTLAGLYFAPKPTAA
jgi:hypothetical protein